VGSTPILGIDRKLTVGYAEENIKADLYHPEEVWPKRLKPDMTTLLIEFAKKK
jgi:hypothetical protein